MPFEVIRPLYLYKYLVLNISYPSRHTSGDLDLACMSTDRMPDGSQKRVWARS